jgi:hypothetical protein
MSQLDAVHDEKASIHDGASTSKEGKHAVGVHVQDVLEGSEVDPVYHAKAHILNNALQEIGMGKYQV